ncbi:1104_t:CDS:1, partial [Racocetra persica]
LSNELKNQPVESDDINKDNFEEYEEYNIVSENKDKEIEEIVATNITDRSYLIEIDEHE